MNPRRVVHNEEHGGVIIWWGAKVTAATIAKLQRLLSAAAGRRARHAVPVARQQDRDHRVDGRPVRVPAHGYYGFGHVGICSDYTPRAESAFTAFRDAYRGKGPEGIPLCDDEPGDTPQSGSC